jgi:hypothetical protein
MICGHLSARDASRRYPWSSDSSSCTSGGWILCGAVAQQLCQANRHSPLNSVDSGAAPSTSMSVANNAWTTKTAGGFSKWAVLGYGIGNGLGGAGVLVTSGTFKIAWLIPVGEKTLAIWWLPAAENNSP